ncbi:MAG: spermidine/putrescine ABC transporter substrate-binding protein, partial [Halodesulfurarchaeum sp.]
NWTYFGSPNEAAEEYIKESILENESIYPPDAVMQKLEFIRNVGEARKHYSRAWTEIQNA